MNRQDVRASSKEILEYLSRRPGQEDTFGGVASWWVKANKGEHGIDELAYVLSLLIEKGDIEEIGYKRDVIVYKIKKGLGK